MKYVSFIIFIVFSISAARAQSERSLVSDGNRMYRDKKYADAEASYRKALEKNKELQQGAFNLGDALYKQERFGEAAEQYTISATRAADARTKAQAYHNLGNALLKGQKLPESIAAYKDALKLNPSDADTKYNLAYAKALLQQQQQKQDQQKKDKNQKKDDKKEKQNQEQRNKDQQKQDQQQDQQKQDKQGENQKAQQQDQKHQDQQKAQQVKKMQISKEDAERILEALKNEEKDVQKKLHKKAPARTKVEKDW